MNFCIEDLETTVASAGIMHSVAGPAVPVYVIIMILVRTYDPV
jgi:hypothetical protein